MAGSLPAGPRREESRMKTISQAKSHGGVQGVYSHASDVCACDMTFAVFVPPRVAQGPLPVVWYLSGLTCTHANVMDKGEYRRMAAELGLIVVCPDTSPRGADLPDEKDNWQFGSGAGFYLDATEAPYARNYRMYAYVTEELPALIASEFPTDMTRQAIFGHSMGGHGALVLGLRNPDLYRSISAFAPICAPSQAAWGIKAFSEYLGTNKNDWENYDANELIKKTTLKTPILIDQGLDDEFLANELFTDEFERTAKAHAYPATIRRQEGYDHSYFFISTFMEEHLAFHAKILKS